MKNLESRGRQTWALVCLTLPRCPHLLPNPILVLWGTLPQFGRDYELTKCCLFYFLGTLSSLPCSCHVQLLSSGQWILGMSDRHQAQAWSPKTPCVVSYALPFSPFGWLEAQDSRAPGDEEVSNWRDTGSLDNYIKSTPSLFFWRE